MPPTSVSRRRIALLAGDHRYDLAVPLDDTLEEIVHGLGLAFVAGRHALVDASGRTAAPTSRADELGDGALLTLIELDAATPEPRRRVRRPRDLAERGTAWWLLGVAGLLLAGLVIADAGSGMLLPDVAVRVLAGILLAGGAAASALLWVAHAPTDTPASALSMLAPVVVAFAGGAILAPPLLPGAGHLAVTAGLLAAGILVGLLAVVLTRPRLRAGARTATVVLLVLAAVWGATLFLGAGPVAAAAISAGLVPLGLRALPSTLLEVPEGHHIDYRHFMTSRWTVRGEIPQDPGPVAPTQVRAEVAESSARLLVGGVLLAAVPPLVVPLVLSGLGATDPFVFGGTVALLAALVLALLLTPRSAAHPVLRWAPRVSAALVLGETAFAFAATGPSLVLTVAAGALLVLALTAAALVVPIARGLSSLGWSRLADAGEWIAVAIALAAGLLAADALDFVRGMMAA
jgi:hypothetical protein